MASKTLTPIAHHPRHHTSSLLGLNLHNSKHVTRPAQRATRRCRAAPAEGNGSSKESSASAASLDQQNAAASNESFIDKADGPSAAGLYQSWSITPAAGVNSYAGYQRQQLLEQRQQQQEHQQLIQQLEADGDMFPMQPVQPVQQMRKKLPTYSRYVEHCYKVIQLRRCCAPLYHAACLHAASLQKDFHFSHCFATACGSAAHAASGNAGTARVMFFQEAA
jgi:hypothetical protein